MANLNPVASSRKSGPKRVPRVAIESEIPAADVAQADTELAPLTHAQQEILGMLDGTWTQVDDARVAENTTQGLGVDVALATVGAAGIFGGMALLFFATAVGAVVLVLGCLTCTLAFEHALVADTAEQNGAEAEQKVSPMANSLDS